MPDPESSTADDRPEPGSTFEIAAIDTDGDGRPDTIIQTSAQGVDLDGDGRNDIAVIRSTRITDLDGDGTPDILERETTVVGDLDGDDRLDTTVVVERRILDPAGLARASARQIEAERRAGEGGGAGPVANRIGITGVQHVSINVDDTEAALAFYVEGLGLTPIPRPDIGIAGAWLIAPNGVQVHLIELPGGGNPNNHFALDVVDIDAAIAAVREAGIEAGNWNDIGTGRQVFLRDPSGNIVELNQA